MLDTSVIVRYLTGDPPNLAGQAARIIDTVDDLRITGVVVVESAYVLTTVYQVPREIAVDHLVTFLQKENISPLGLDKGLVLQGLLLCRPSGQVSFADAMVWAAARSSGMQIVYSFDERFPADGLEVRGSG